MADSLWLVTDGYQVHGSWLKGHGSRGLWLMAWFTMVAVSSWLMDHG
jgi:hypothetical protein